MRLPDFKLERYLDKYEFSAPYLLCCSDCETFTVSEILELEGEGALDALLNLRLGYTETRGNPDLRRAVAGLYRTVGPDQVLVASGAEEAIFIFMNVALRPGDHVIVQYPCYQSLLEVAKAVGCEVTKWVIKEGQNGWETDLDLLAAAVRENTRAIIVNSPHNPTGYLLTPGEMETIINIARRSDILLFADEVYRHLEYDAGGRREAACDLYENAVSLGVMSKTYGLAGLRIGWIATRNRDIYGRVAAFKDYTSICNSGPSEFLAALALNHRDRLVERNLGIIRDNLGVLDRFFAEHSDLFSWPRPKAGPIAFPSLKRGASADEFCADLVASKGVLLLPASCYDFGDRHFRIGYGRRSMPEGVEKN